MQPKVSNSQQSNTSVVLARHADSTQPLIILKRTTDASGQLHTLAFTLRERAIGILWIGSRVGPRSGLCAVQNENICLKPYPAWPVFQPVTRQSISLFLGSTVWFVCVCVPGDVADFVQIIVSSVGHVTKRDAAPGNLSGNEPCSRHSSCQNLHFTAKFILSPSYELTSFVVSFFIHHGHRSAELVSFICPLCTTLFIFQSCHMALLFYTCCVYDRFLIFNNLERNSVPFTEPEVLISVPCSQEPATGPHAEPDESSSHPHALLL
jgi:hypothetical protein